MGMKESARGIAQYILDIRRRIHARPELGFEERETTRLIAWKLSALGIPYRLMEPTGVLAEIRGEGTKTVLLRADIDALPITEETGLPFSSKNEGLCHACGHDAHAAMLLGAARRRRFRCKPSPAGKRPRRSPSFYP